jgi:peptide/nickel transport system substrate-binding protein
VTEEGKLRDDLLGPPDGSADWDFYMWGWVGDPDPMSLLSFFTTDALGGSNDSFFTDPEYDDLFGKQQKATDEAERKGYIQRMQEIFYEKAPYHVLYYDSELHAYRTDKFANWTNQPPDNGTPLFGYGPIGYTVLTDASAEPSAAPSASAPAASSAGPSATAGNGGTPTSSTSNNAFLLVAGIAALVLVLAIALVIMRRRGATGEEE